MNKDAFELFGSLADINRRKWRQESKAANKVQVIKEMYEEQSEKNEKLARKNQKLKKKVTALKEEVRTQQNRIDKLECGEPRRKQIKTEYDSEHGDDVVNSQESTEEVPVDKVALDRGKH